MPAKAAIYLPVESPDLTKVFPDARARGSLPGKPELFSLVLNGDAVTFNVLPQNELTGHLSGFLRYIASLNEEEQRKADASTIARMSKCVLGLQTTREFEDNHAIWQALFKIAAAFDGYILVHDSLLLPNGGVIFGPLRKRA